ncbi:hypothetical protein APR41_05545 [Salegentibacter salinarum]|uniref:Uncharacterized protein n=1 Tax=Salegentibacter salinarum TaxID=447422 RepID=A0A2N0TSF8_9FLAO|nr:hypothetical protein APR41_05545 [Salegentibacter salinarum]
MHLAAIAYNLKKYLKFRTKKVKSGAVALQNFQSSSSFIISTRFLTFQTMSRLLFSQPEISAKNQDLFKKPQMVLKISF